jgi:hypothetical protein
MRSTKMSWQGLEPNLWPFNRELPGQSCFHWLPQFSKNSVGYVECYFG